VGRALLADAAWTNKIREGRETEITCFEPAHIQRFD
jgi:2,4-dienoyl-CoA reductase-like NADH-dependent reductase (Old Yellow Enzyme family)